MRGRKQDYWMSCSIVLKNTKQNATSTASGNKNRNLYQRCGLGITC